MKCTVKGVVVELVLLATIAATIYQAMAYIDPMIKNSKTKEGACKMRSLTWADQYCGATGRNVSVPIISGYFSNRAKWSAVTINDSYYINTYVSLHKDIPTVDYYNNIEPIDIEAFLYDDGSGSLIIPTFNCSNATAPSTKTLLVSYFPQLYNVIDVNSTEVEPYIDNFSPPIYFVCWFGDGRALLYFDDVDLILILPFIVSFFAYLFAVYPVSRHGDQPFKSFCAGCWAQHVLGILFAFHAVVHYGVLVPIAYVRGLLSGEPVNYQAVFEEGWFAGGACFPLVQLYTCLERRFEKWESERAEREERTPPPTSHTSARSSNERLDREVDVADNQPSLDAPSFSPAIPPSYSQAFEVGTVLPNLSVVGRPAEEIMSAPPPSYEEVVRAFENFRV